MAATISRSYSRVNSCINGIKHLQLCTSIPSKIQTCTVLKNVHRSTWYRSFFRSDQTTSSSNRLKDSETKPVTGPSKPKKPSNVFLVYMQNVQDSIKQSNPSLKRPQIVSEAAKRWKEFDPEEKSKMTMERKELYDNYKREMINYVENLTPEQIMLKEKEKRKKTLKKINKARKQLGMPEKPLSSYAWFLSEIFTERADEPVQNFFKQAKDKWNDMPDHEKNIYYEKQKRSQKQYQNDMASWEEHMIEAGRFDVLRSSTRNKLMQAKGKKRESKNENKVIEKSRQKSE